MVNCLTPPLYAVMPPAPQDILIDAPRRLLLRNGAALPLGGRAFDLLLVLIEAKGQPVVAETLIKRVWPGVTVSTGNLRVQVRALRRVLGDDAVATEPGTGYRLTLPLWNHTQTETSIVAPTHLLGRLEEQERIASLLAENRLVTIVGPGGVGKTSLALDIARLYRAGAHAHIELAPIRHAGLVPLVAAAALALRVVQADVMTAIRESIGDRPTLLVLDNAEHLLDEVAEFAEALLGHLPEVRLLVTSREPLNLSGERIFHLCPLACSPERETDPQVIASYPAVALVLHCLVQAGGLTPSDVGRVVIAHLCRQLDGLPLALILLAAQIRDHGISAVAGRLDGRFQDLSLPAEAVSRHSTLTRMLDWSAEQLPPEEKLLLRRLTVFTGVWPVEAAQHVCGGTPLDSMTVPGLLAGLASRSLLSGPAQSGKAGLHMLATIRHYAERLVLPHPPEDLRPRLAQWIYGVLLDYREQLLRLPRDKVNRDIDPADIREVLEWSLGGADLALGQEIAALAITRFVAGGLYAEAARYLTRAWELCTADTPLALRALLCIFIHGEAQPLRLPTYADRARFTRDDLDAYVDLVTGSPLPVPLILDALFSASWLKKYAGDDGGRVAILARAMEICRGQDVPIFEIRCLSLIGCGYADLDQPEAARDAFRRAVALSEGVGESTAIVKLRWAEAEFCADKTDDAIQLVREALAAHQASTMVAGNYAILQQVLLANLSSYFLSVGRLQEALRPALAALQVMIDSKQTQVLGWTLERGALLALRLGEVTFAQQLAGAAEQVITRDNSRRTGPEKAVHTLLLAELPAAETEPALLSAEEALPQLLDLYMRHVGPEEALT